MIDSVLGARGQEISDEVREEGAINLFPRAEDHRNSTSVRARGRKTRKRLRGEREGEMGRKTRTEKEVPREESKADWERERQGD